MRKNKSICFAVLEANVEFMNEIWHGAFEIIIYIFSSIRKV
jgi:hypothetical protein